MPLNVVIELCKITKASKLFQRNFYLPLLEPLSPKDALRRHLIASEAQLLRMEHYIPVLEEYEKRQARRKLIVKGQVKKRQKRKASMRYVTPLLDITMPGHPKLRNIFTRKSKGQGQCYTYRVPDKNCTVVITHQMERAIRDKDIIDVMVSQKNDKVVFVLKNNQRVSVPLVNYEGDAPFYRGDGWTTKEIESTHHYGKETMAITNHFEGKEQILEAWELDMMDMAALRKQKMKCEDTREWKALMSNQVKNIDWELFENQAKQIVQEQYTPVEDLPISMKVSSIEDTMNVNEKLQKSEKAVMELLPTVSDIPEIIKAMKDGELAEVANVSGVKVKYMKKDYFVPGQMVKWEDSDLLVPGQTVFNDNGDTEYVPGFTVAIEGSPTLIPGLVMGNDPNKPIFLPGLSTITESGILKFTETEDDLAQELDKNSDDEECEEMPLPSKLKVLEASTKPKRQIRELPDVVKDTEIAIQALPPRYEGNGGHEADGEVESENGDEMDDETESTSIASVIEVIRPPTDIDTSAGKMASHQQEVREETMMGYSNKIPPTEFIGAEKGALAEENRVISKQLKVGEEQCENKKSHEQEIKEETLTTEFLAAKTGTMPEENLAISKQLDVGEQVKKEKSHEQKIKEETVMGYSKKTLTIEFIEQEKRIIAEENRMTSKQYGAGEDVCKKEESHEQEVTEDTMLDHSTKTLTTGTLAKENPEISKQPNVGEQCKREESDKNLEREDEKVNEELIEKPKLEKTETTTTEADKTEDDHVGEKNSLTSMEPVLGQLQDKTETRDNLEDGNPRPMSLTSNTDAVADRPVELPEDIEESPAINIGLAVEPIYKVEEMKDQSVKVEVVDQATHEHLENDLPVKNQLAQHQTHKEYKANRTLKEGLTIETTLKKQDKKIQRENLETLIVDQSSEELVTKQEDKNNYGSDQIVQKQKVMGQTAEEHLAKQVEKEERVNGGLIQNKTEEVHALGEQATDKQEPEDVTSKMQSVTMLIGNQDVKNQVSEETKEEVLHKNNSNRQTVKVLVVCDQLGANHTITMNLPVKDGGIKLDDEEQMEDVPLEEHDAEEISDESSTKEIKFWSTIVKELFEVSVVVASCYFINKLGKNLFNISV
nr:unnamed protein product [Callosobruchus analis]